MSHLAKLWAAVTAKPKLTQLQSFACLLTFVLASHAGIVIAMLAVWLADKVHNMLAFVVAMVGIIGSFGLGIKLARQVYWYFRHKNELKHAPL